MEDVPFVFDLVDHQAGVFSFVGVAEVFSASGAWVELCCVLVIDE